MALQVQVPSRISQNGIVGSSFPLRKCVCFIIPTQRWSENRVTLKKKKKNGGLWCSGLDIVGPVVGEVTEVDKDTFWPLVNAALDKIVVLDMYTQWCGPCKIIAPKYKALSEKYSDVVFLKLDCSKENRSLAKELGIKVVPTFKIIKDAKIIKEVTGAKINDLVAAIETVRTS